MKILIVDDEEDIREIIAHMLSETYETVSCANGAEAIAQIRKDNFNLIITDMVMPEKGGMELASYIKNNDLPLPVLAISGNFSEESEGMASYFADDTLPKPFTEEQLLKAVETLLANKSAVDLYGSYST